MILTACECSRSLRETIIGYKKEGLRKAGIPSVETEGQDPGGFFSFFFFLFEIEGIFFFFNYFLEFTYFLMEREREQGRAEREGDTESEAGSRL